MMVTKATALNGAGQKLRDTVETLAVRKSQTVVLEYSRVNQSQMVSSVIALLFFVQILMGAAVMTRQAFDRSAANVEVLVAIYMAVMAILSAIGMYLGKKNMTMLVETIFFAVGYQIYGLISQFGMRYKLGHVELWFVAIVAFIAAAYNSGHLMFHARRLKGWISTKYEQHQKAAALRAEERKKAIAALPKADPNKLVASGPKHGRGLFNSLGKKPGDKPVSGNRTGEDSKETEKAGAPAGG